MNKILGNSAVIDFPELWNAKKRESCYKGVHVCSYTVLNILFTTAQIYTRSKKCSY